MALRSMLSILLPAFCACAQIPKVSSDGQAPLAPVPGDPTALEVSTAALGVPFLLAPLVVQQTASPQVEYLKARVVRFQDNGQSIALVEDNLNVVYSDLGAVKLLASFPVVQRGRNALRIRCVPFLPALSLEESWGTSDTEDGFAAQVASAERVLPVLASWGADVRSTLGGVRISQIVRVAISGEDGGREEITAHVRYDLWAQPAKEAFAARFSTAQRGVGFFEIPFFAGRTGAVAPIATRWNLSPELDPVTVRVTGNVPEALRGAVEDGITYWNRALGFEALKIVHGADPGYLPERRELIVRWVTWDTAGFAVAKFQANPLTGEILRAEAMLTSFWTGVTQGLTSTGEGDGAESSASIVAWPGRVCRKAPPGIAFAAAGPGAGVARRAAADMIRQVTAHEVGHTLGLRHNFAGSTATEFADVDAHFAAWRGYLGGSDAGAQTSSSVMDYLEPMDDVLLGARLRRAPLPYDAVAMGWGYRGAELEQGPDAAPFCTDGQLGDTPACAKFDGGQNPLAFAARSTAFRISQLPAAIVAVLTSAQTPADILSLPSPAERAQRVTPATLARYAAAPALNAARRAASSANGSAVVAASTRSSDLALAAGGAKGIADVALQALGPDRDWIRREVARLLSASPPPGGRPVTELAVLRELGALLAGATELELVRALQPFTVDAAEEEPGDDVESGADERRWTERHRPARTGAPPRGPVPLRAPK